MSSSPAPSSIQRTPFSEQQLEFFDKILKRFSYTKKQRLYLRDRPMYHDTFYSGGKFIDGYYTVFMFACQLRRPKDVARRTLELIPEADINLLNRFGESALSVAISHGNINTAKFLLSRPELKGSDELPDHADYSFLGRAVRFYPELTRLLMDSGKFDFNLRDKDGNPPFFYATDPETWQLLAANPAINLRAHGHQGMDGLCHAVDYISFMSEKHVHHQVLPALIELSSEHQRAFDLAIKKQNLDFAKTIFSHPSTAVVIPRGGNPHPSEPEWCLFWDQLEGAKEK